jgi:hypothetical protein
MAHRMGLTPGFQLDFIPLRASAFENRGGCAIKGTNHRDLSRPPDRSGESTRIDQETYHVNRQ